MHSINVMLLSFGDCYRKFDIYKDPAPSEAIAAVPVLTDLMERVKGLLKEWPDHPVLNQVYTPYYVIFSSIKICSQILAAIDKVLSLNVSEPLMKTLSGMEYIMRKAQVSMHVGVVCSVTLYPYAIGLGSIRKLSCLSLIHI